ncbi:MAG TPA: hypothetical protein VH458_24985 [Vicinamibacterales bacterium]|jgi:hypothetical protein
MCRAVWLAFILVVVSVVPARAGAEFDPVSTAPLATAVDRAAQVTGPALPAWAADHPVKRPTLLPVLYGSYAALEIMDVQSTRRALAAGATEANPALKSGGATAIAIKAATGAATIYFVERAWKKNRVGGIVLMAALNGVTAAVVAHNSHNARR